MLYRFGGQCFHPHPNPLPEGEGILECSGAAPTKLVRAQVAVLALRRKLSCLLP